MISIWNTSNASPQPDLQRIVSLTRAMGSEQFPASLLDSLAHWVNSQHFNVLRIAAGHPSLLLAGSRHRDRRLVWRCWDDYSQRFHNHDELASRMQSHPPMERPLIGHLLAEDISFSPYRQEIYQRHDMSERLCSLSWDDQGAPLMLNLYRHRDAGYFRDHEIQAFEQLTPALLQLVRGHLALQRQEVPAESWRATLLRAAPQLTEKELEVCLLLLRGLTHAGIGAALGIKETTVKTYRNRAFLRLNINFRSQLFALVTPPCTPAGTA
ncbi:LuxR C-terminal-related transcriptional regulator [Pseudomonas sp. S 311-6]|uniref:Regulatory LuxR family protein n=1 Tax=Kerstersia gyiorum TaxID=206506 RepID=A0A4V2F1A5_9BURK|nr:LuxR C-terminal-related transcriptional regulator [Kerstersia gyiorum]KAB0544032.1 LuxR family transcriptional regulator [Kerstersia gyiorum]MCO7636820.1 LuxR C-terminal-related transcriptional regulator [Pseudomonas sp. S 311-6]RZS73007.1 regulatory LuxR family protein [Kerstersia gyiorum]